MSDSDNGDAFYISDEERKCLNNMLSIIMRHNGFENCLIHSYDTDDDDWSHWYPVELVVQAIAVLGTIRMSRQKIRSYILNDNSHLRFYYVEDSPFYMSMRKKRHQQQRHNGPRSRSDYRN